MTTQCTDPFDSSYRPDTQTRRWFNDVISDYSHSVRGRIMSIKLRITILERKAATPENQAYIDQLKLEVDDLTQMIEKLQSNSKKKDS